MKNELKPQVSVENLTAVPKSFDLNVIKKGMYICWNVSAQACFDSTVTIKDDTTTYAIIKKGKTRTPEFLFLNEGHHNVDGNNLTVIVESTESRILKSSVNAFTVTSDSGRAVGCGYNICIEDQDDNDYNNVYINIVAWEKKG